jgi:hypothetical protein
MRVARPRQRLRSLVRVSTTIDGRFDIPLYTTAEAARFLGVPTSTFATWAKGYLRRPPGRSAVIGEPIVTSASAEQGYPTVPFVGLAEAMIIAAFRGAGISLQHIRRAVGIIQRQIGLDHALASERLYTDGAVILFDYAESEHDRELSGLTEVVSRQRLFAPVIEDYLKRIEYGGNLPTRPSSLISGAIYVRQRPDHPFCAGSRTHRTHRTK